MEEWNSYLIDGTDVLKNKLGITDKDELNKVERKKVVENLTCLGLSPIKGDFDSHHFCMIHKFLFNDIYDFAGKFRTCTLAKPKCQFLEPEIIEEELNRILTNLNEGLKNIYVKEQYIFLLASTYYELTVAHPFREGNGRTIREFFREFVEAKNNELPFNLMLDLTKIDKDEALLAVQERYLYPSLLENVFEKALVEIDEEKNKKF